MFDGAAFGEEMVGIVRTYVDRVTAPLVEENKHLRERIEALEARAPEKGEPGRDGADGLAGRDGLDGSDGRDGKDGDQGPAGEPGANGRDGEDGRDGLDGKDGQDGKDGAPGERGKDGNDGKDGRDGHDGLDGKDGAGIADLLIDRAGELVATFTDGRVKSLGPVIGKDGRDGQNGADGRDGMGPEDIVVDLMDDGRTVRLAFIKGETEYAFNIPFPVTLDRGVFKEGEAYTRGDAVTWGGSLWIAQKDTSAKPDTADSGWRLAVKRGRDGKDLAK